MTLASDPVQPDPPAAPPIDLNLLVVFDAVMVERNLRRAGDRLGRSQPAVSQAVARLRDLTGDRLFVKVPTGVEPTPRAEALWREVREPLRVIGAALDHRGFDPRAARGEVVLGLADDVHEMAFAALVSRLRAEAPGIVPRVVPTDHRVAWAQLGTGSVDLAVTVAPPPPRALGARVILDQGFVVVHRGDAAGPATLGRFLAATHVGVAFSDREPGYVDERLAAMGHTRHVIAWTPRFASIPELVRRTGALATIPEPIARHHLATAGAGLVLSPVPFALQPVPVRMGWHQRRRMDPLHEWVRGVVGGVVAERLDGAG